MAGTSWLTESAAAACALCGAPCAAGAASGGESSERPRSSQKSRRSAAAAEASDQAPGYRPGVFVCLGPELRLSFNSPTRELQLAWFSLPGSARLAQLAWFSSRARAAPGLSQSPAGVRGESGRSPSLTAWQSCGKLRVTLGSSLCCVSSTRTLRSCSFSTGRLSGGFLFSDSELSSTTLLEGLAVNVGPTKLINVLPSCVTARLPKKLSLTAWPDQAVKLEWSPAVRTAWVRGESGVSRDRHSLACPGPGPARWPGRASALPGPRASSKRPRAGTQRP